MTIPTDDFPPIGGASLVDAELAKGSASSGPASPSPGAFSVSSLPFVLFGIPFTAFAFFWIAVAGAFRFPGVPGPFGLFALFGIPFVIVGLGLLMSPFWMYLKARRTAYAITDRRALVIEPDLWGRIIVRSFEPGAWPCSFGPSTPTAPAISSFSASIASGAGAPGSSTSVSSPSRRSERPRNASASS